MILIQTQSLSFDYIFGNSIMILKTILISELLKFYPFFSIGTKANYLKCQKSKCYVGRRKMHWNIPIRSTTTHVVVEMAYPTKKKYH